MAKFMTEVMTEKTDLLLSLRNAAGVFQVFKINSGASQNKSVVFTLRSCDAFGTRTNSSVNTIAIRNFIIISQINDYESILVPGYNTKNMEKWVEYQCKALYLVSTFVLIKMFRIYVL